MDTIPTSWQDSLSLGITYTVAQISSYFPKMLAAAVILILGVFFAKLIRNLVSKMLSALRFSKLMEKTPAEQFLKNDELGRRMEEGLASVIYWLLLFLVVHTVVSVLGLNTLSQVLDRILFYIPHVFSALFIFILGVLLAGVAETMVKASLKTIDLHTARLFAKVASYLVVTVASLAAIAELGIASQFILILFVGVVFALALAAGLSLGLGGRATVERLLEQWQKRGE